MLVQWFIAFLFSFAVYGQTSPKILLDEVVVTSKRGDTVQETLANVEVISEEEIEKSGESNVIDLLRKTGGFDFSQNGGKGTQAGLFYRGMERRHLLVLIDGVKVSDPADPDRNFDFSRLDLSDVERIEIVKGSGSVLYGSEAIAGVLNIITKKAKKDEVSITLKEGIQKSAWAKASKVNENSRFNLQASVSEANYNSSARSGDEFDKYENQNYSGFYEYSITDKIFINFLAKIQKGYAEYDNSNNTDSYENRTIHLDQLYSQNLEVNTDSSKFNLKLSHHRLDRKIESQFPSFFYVGKSNQAEINYSRNISDMKLIIGSDFEKESAENSFASVKDATTTSLYTSLAGNISRFSWDAGLRGTKHSLYSSMLVGEASAGYEIDSRQKVRLHYGTSFNSPSLDQLYASYGDEDLMPEKSKNIDLSYEFKTQNTKQTLALFYYEISNLIIFNPQFEYENSGDFRTKGAEYSFLYFNNSWQGEFIVSSQTFDKETPLRRAHEKVNLNLSYFLNDQHEFSMQNRWNGYRYDNPGSGRVKLDAYTVSDFAYYFHFDKSRLGARVNNLFNEDYEIAKGYSVDRVNYAFELSTTF